MFAQYRGSNIQGVARVLLSDGSLDGVFTQAVGIGANFTALCNSVLYFNNSIYLAGTFIVYRGAPAIGLAKVHPTTGVLDGVFTQATALGGAGTGLFDDGADLYVSSTATLYRGSAAPYLIKLNPNSGNLDPAYNSATGPNVSSKILGVIDGNVLASSYTSGLSSYRGDNVKEFLSVSSTDGSLSTNFKTTSGFDSKCTALKKYQNKFSSGSFSSYRGQAAKYFMVIDPVTGNAP